MFYCIIQFGPWNIIVNIIVVVAAVVAVVVFMKGTVILCVHVRSLDDGIF